MSKCVDAGIRLRCPYTPRWCRARRSRGLALALIFEGVPVEIAFAFARRRLGSGCAFHCQKSFGNVLNEPRKVTHHRQKRADSLVRIGLGGDVVEDRPVFPKNVLSRAIKRLRWGKSHDVALSKTCYSSSNHSDQAGGTDA